MLDLWKISSRFFFIDFLNFKIYMAHPVLLGPLNTTVKIKNKAFLRFFLGIQSKRVIIFKDVIDHGFNSSKKNLFTNNTKLRRWRHSREACNWRKFESGKTQKKFSQSTWMLLEKYVGDFGNLNFYVIGKHLK